VTPLEILAEWRKGCSCAPKERPEECPMCTRAAMDAIELRLRQHQSKPSLGFLLATKLPHRFRR